MTFTGYYSSSAREGFITAALRSLHGWSIITRNNPGQHFPSDFSLVEVCLVAMVLLTIITCILAAGKHHGNSCHRGTQASCTSEVSNKRETCYVSRPIWYVNCGSDLVVIPFLIQIPIQNTNTIIGRWSTSTAWCCVLASVQCLLCVCLLADNS